MIAELRSRHRRMLAPLAVLSTLVFVLALRARVDSMPLAEENRKQAEEPMQQAAGVVLDEIWSELAMDCSLGADGKLQLAAEEDLQAPDVLLYWSSASTSEGEGGLPPESRLLGRLVGTRTGNFQLPAEAESKPGYLHLYSLARAQILASAKLPGGN